MYSLVFLAGLLVGQIHSGRIDDLANLALEIKAKSLAENNKHHFNAMRRIAIENALKTFAETQLKMSPPFSADELAVFKSLSESHAKKFDKEKAWYNTAYGQVWGWQQDGVIYYIPSEQHQQLPASSPSCANGRCPW